MPPVLPGSLRSPLPDRPTEGVPAPAVPGWWEGIAAGFRTGRDQMDSTVQAPRQYDAYADALDALGKLGVDTSINGPLYDDGATSIMAMTPGGPVYAGPPGRNRVLNHDKVFAAMQAQRAINGQVFGALPKTRAEWDQQIATRFGARARDAAVAGNAPVASMIGGVGAAVTDPALVMTMVVGGGGTTFARFVLGAALAGGAGGVVMLPDKKAAMDRMGEPYGAADMAGDVAMAAAGTVVLGVGGKYIAPAAAKAAAGGAAKVAAPVLEAGLARIIPHLPEALRPKLTGLADVPDAELANAFEKAVGPQNMTEAERGAVSILRRSGDEAASNPYVPDGAGVRAHQSALQAAMDRITAGMPAPSAKSRAASGSGLASGTVRAPGEPGLLGRDAEAYVVNRIAGNPRVEGTGRNPDSSAVGLGQFVDDTFVRVFRRTFPEQAKLGKAAILKKRGTGVERAMLERFTADNADALRAARQPVTPANLYLAHFLGEGDAVKVLGRSADTPLEGLISPASIKANAGVLAGRTVGDVLAFAERKMGTRGDAGGVPGGALDEDAALSLARTQAANDVAAAEGAVRDVTTAPAIDAETAALAQPVGVSTSLDTNGGAPGPTLRPEYRGEMPHYLESIKASEINVDAQTFQFKAGGDAQGVTDALTGAKKWEPGFSDKIIVWQDREGRFFVADGHQRTALARRIGAREGRDISLDAYVLREADGVSAQDARTFAAMSNIAKDRGTILDMAKVIRDAGMDALDKAGVARPVDSKARYAEGLARLSPDAFGAVINKVIPERYGALIGERLPDSPEAHGALVDLLAKTKPANLAQADDIVRQGIEAGFRNEFQTDMFGQLSTMASLFAERAKVKEAAMAKLRSLKRIHNVAANEAGTLESAGSKIEVASSRQEALSNDEALALIDRLAWSAGPVKDAIDRAAGRLAAGERIATVSADLARDIRAIDLRRAAMDGPDAGGDAGGGVAPSDLPLDVRVNADGSRTYFDRNTSGTAFQRFGPYDPAAEMAEVTDAAAGWRKWHALQEDPTSAPPFDDGQQAMLLGLDDPEGAAADRQMDSARHDLDLFAAENPDLMITPDAGSEPVRLADYLREADAEEQGLDVIEACLAPTPATPPAPKGA